MKSFYLVLFAVVVVLAGCGQDSWPPSVQQMSESSPVLSPDQALETFQLPPGYSVELVASEPLVVDPVAVEFDADGRMWVVEMRSYMPNLQAEGERTPTGQIAVLEDADNDGRMDQRTVYLDSLVLPRSIKVLEKGVLVAAPPNLWFAQDTSGDGQADIKKQVRSDYGNPASNPEHNANGLIWGMDNWIHNADYGGRLRYQNGGFEYAPSVDHGQWGISMDDYGRMYLNSNSDPLRVDLLPAHYYQRNPDMMRRQGLYYDLVEDESVWPARPTPGVNRGYRPGLLREKDSTLSRFTAAGSPVVYRGDRLPEELQNNVFVSEPSGNLVRRFVISERKDGRFSAHNAYREEQTEFMTSTDERFRPVNFYSGPDGTLYVVDMYRGVIQHQNYVTDYLERQIRRRDLEKPVGLGRIYRIVHTSTQRDNKPALSQKTAVQLVEYLNHPNGWWRDVAQRLIVERGDTAAVPKLQQLVTSAKDHRARLHALWSLEGLEAVDLQILKKAFLDKSAHVRASAVRIAEPWLAKGNSSVYTAVEKLMDDKSPTVRRQLAASLGELPPSKRKDALTEVLFQHGEDPIVIDAVVSGLYGQEISFLDYLLNKTGRIGQMPGRKEAVQMLAAAVVNSGASEKRNQVFQWIGEENRSRWQRLALMQGVERFAPELDEGKQGDRAELTKKPQGLLAAVASKDSLLQHQARTLAKRFYWPGKPQQKSQRQVDPLTPKEKQRFKQGRTKYVNSCAPCHQENGQGQPDGPARLVGSDWVLGKPAHLVRVVLQGKEGDNLMPPMGKQLSNQDVAAILTYVRRAWGNRASAVDAQLVDSVRQEIKGRQQPWTDVELRALAEQ